MKNTEINLEALFDEIVERGRAEGVEEEQGFKDLVEEVVVNNSEDENWEANGEMSEVMDQLRGRWEEYQKAIGLAGSEDEIDQ